MNLYANFGRVPAIAVPPIVVAKNEHREKLFFAERTHDPKWNKHRERKPMTKLMERRSRFLALPSAFGVKERPPRNFVFANDPNK